MKYFIITGYLPDIKHSNLVRLKTKNGWKDFKSPFLLDTKKPLAIKRITSIKNVGSINKVFYGGDRGLFLIITKTQRNAYLLCGLFKHVLSIYFLQFKPEDMLIYNIIELQKSPTTYNSFAEILNEDLKFDEDKKDAFLLQNKLQSGTIINDYDLYQLKCMLPHFIKNQRLALSLEHLYYSHTMFSSAMSGSFYSSHYRWERQEQKKYFREKTYFENRVKLELAFLSAFRAIELILGTPNLNKDNIEEHINRLDNEFNTIFSTKPVNRFFEIFSGSKKKISWKELLQHFLLLRNAVAAHGISKPKFLLHDDQVFEIQKQCEDMIYYCVFSDEMHET